VLAASRPSPAGARVRAALTRLRAALLEAGQWRSPNARHQPKESNAMPRKNTRTSQRITLDLPPEFIALCKQDNVPPEVVLRGFIADLAEIINWANNPRADGYSSNGSDERRYAMEYYERVGYPWLFKPQR
jgi:hypothetical protein